MARIWDRKGEDSDKKVWYKRSGFYVDLGFALVLIFALFYARGIEDTCNAAYYDAVELLKIAPDDPYLLYLNSTKHKDILSFEDYMAKQALNIGDTQKDIDCFNQCLDKNRQ